MAEKGVLTKLTGFFGLYAVFVFVAGRTFFDYYYEAFGIDPRWLDLGFADVMIRGFTALLLRTGAALWPIYIFVILAPVGFELTSRFSRKPTLQAFFIAILLALIPVTYWVAGNAGRQTAMANKGIHTSLPYVTFETKAGSFGGRLLLFRAGMIFVHDVVPTNPVGTEDNVNLHVYRSEEISDFEVTERPK